MSRHFLPEPLGGSRHAIDTLVWNGLYPDADLASRRQQDISAFLRGPGLAVIGRVFDSFSGAGEVWQIDSLDLRLGRFGPDSGPSDWAARLERVLTESLLRLRYAADGGALAEVSGQAVAGVTHSAEQQDLLNFLFYLRHGRLPWSMLPVTGPALSEWLERLARRDGGALWERLHEPSLGSFVLLRLSRISPHRGLQALLAVRNAELGAALIWLDQQILAPFQARGRLSAFQVGLIQQGWRVAALELLWLANSGELDATRTYRLIGRLWEALAAQLGPHWTGFLPVSAAPRRRDTASVAEFSRTLLAGLLSRSREWASGTGVGPRISGGVGSGSFSDSVLARLQACLCSPQPVSHEQSAALLEVLAGQNRPLLRGCLAQQCAALDWRVQAWERLGPDLLGRILLLLDKTSGASAAIPAQAGAGLPPGSATWAESLRQHALRASRLTLLRGVGGSALQAWLAAYTLRYLAAGHSAPQDHVAWQALWDAALRELSGDGPSAPVARPPAETGLADAAPARDQEVPPAGRSGLLSGGIFARRLRWGFTRGGRRLRLRQALPESGQALAAEVPEPVWSGLLKIARRSVDLPPSHLLGRVEAALADQLRQLQRMPSSERLIQRCVSALAEQGRAQAGVSSADALDACLQAWAKGIRGGRAAQWPWLRQAASRKRASLVVRSWICARQWREEIALQWPELRRLELLALAFAETAPEGWQFGAAVTAWEWLPRLLLRQASRHRGRWVAAETRAWLWQEALAWLAVMPSGAAAPGARSLLRHWRRARDAQNRVCEEAAVGVSAGAASSSGLERSTAMPEASPSLPASVAVAALHGLLARPAGQWLAAERLWVARLLARPQVCAEALRRFDGGQRRHLLRCQYPSAAPALLAVAERLERALPRLLPDMPPARLEDLHWRILFAHCFVAAQSLAPQDLVRRYALHLAQVDADRHGRAALSFGLWLNRLAAALEATGSLSAELRAGLGRPPRDAEQWEAGLPSRMRPVALPAAAQPSSDDLPPADATELDQAVFEQSIEPIPIHNAGQVLLAAYHARLFAMFGLLEEKRFVDAAAQALAVHYLAYLTDGECGGNETAWPLNKILCGLAPEFPVEPLVALDEASRDTLDSLLSAVIAHWKALGRTSPAGLRQTFLQREGRLLRERNETGWHWRLKIASGPFDMLLDRIPWSFSVIRSPWMKEVLYVDWR